MTASKHAVYFRTVLVFSADDHVVAQPIWGEPLRMFPELDNSSAAASDIRNPSAINPTAAASARGWTLFERNGEGTVHSSPCPRGVVSEGRFLPPAGPRGRRPRPSSRSPVAVYVPESRPDRRNLIHRDPILWRSPRVRHFVTGCGLVWVEARRHPARSPRARHSVLWPRRWPRSRPKSANP